MSWPVVPLGELSKSRGSYGVGLSSREWQPGDPRYIRITDITPDGRLHPSKVAPKGSKEEWRDALLSPGDLLFARSGATVGKSYIHRASYEPAVYAGYLIRFRLDTTRILPEYVFHYSHSPDYQAWVAGTRRAVAQPNINARQFAALPIPLPPLQEQRRIVDLLEDHLSRLDTGSTQLRMALRRADALVASSLSMHTTRALESEGSRSSTVGAEAVLIEYGTSAKCTLQQHRSDVPVIRMGNLRDGGLDWENLKYLPAENEQFPKLLLQPGDLLFNRTNSAELVGKAALFDGGGTASFASYLIRVRFKDSVDPRWANMVINSPAGRQYVASVVSQQVGQANVNGTKLKAFPMPVPGRDEQERMVARHSDVVEARQRIRAEAGVLLKRSELLRRSLLAAAFSGRLTATSDAEGLVS